jgi:hypothetical protein
MGCFGLPNFTPFFLATAIPSACRSLKPERSFHATQDTLQVTFGYVLQNKLYVPYVSLPILPNQYGTIHKVNFVSVNPGTFGLYSPTVTNMKKRTQTALQRWMRKPRKPL